MKAVALSRESAPALCDIHPPRRCLRVAATC